MAVLLIGSTGNGKSTLGNFLLNPEKEHIFGDNQTFKTARTNKPETQIVQSATYKVQLERIKDTSFSVIDTPGIFEDEDKDIEHMVNIIRALHEVGEVRACILVVKFSSKIDTPYKASIKYYSKLLPGLFENNLIIIMTDYACDERSKNLRALQGIDEEKIKNNILAEIIEVCGVTKSPTLFTIDCLPMSGEEFTINLQTRKDVIGHTFTFQSMPTKDLKVAKTDPIMAADKITIAKLQGEVAAYDERLEQAQVNAHTAHKQVEQHSKRIDGLKDDIINIKDEVAAIDTKELIEAEVWSINTRWRWFKKLSRHFEVVSSWPVQNVKYWTNGKCRFTQREEASEYCVRGRVKSKCNRGLHAKVTLEVYKSDKHGEEIADLKNDISSKEELLLEVVQRHDGSKKKHEEISNEITLLRKNIETRNVEVKKLSSEYLTMEECLERFQL